MKKLILMAVAIVIALTAGAVPAKRGYAPVKQSDGTTITVDMVGDEFHHTFITLDGRTIGRDERGDFYYLTADGLSSVRAHDPIGRPAAEQAFVQANAEHLTPASVMTAEAKARRTRANIRRKATQVPQTGSPHVPIILVNYKDIKFKADDPVAQFRTQFNEGERSCYQYFVDQSRGKYTPNFDILGLVELTYDRAHYGGNNYRGDDKGIGAMVAEAILALEETVDFSPYDNDGDGEIDVVIILYAGVGEAQAYQIVPNSIWPCQWELSESDFGNSLTLQGKTFNKFAVFNELYGSSDATTRIDGIGTFCHEYSHCLGLPDFYATNYSSAYGMGNWSLLDSGCYADDGDTPVGYDAYERNFMGWLELEEPEPGKTYTTDALNLATGRAFKVVNDANSNEYYLLENRQKTGWDTYLPAAGMLITHVDYLQSAWDDNTPNNDASHQRMTIKPADGVLNTSTESRDTYPYNGNDSLTNTSTPAAKVFTGSFMNKPITEIKNNNGVVSFSFMKGKFVKEVPTLTESTNISANSFTANWTPVDSAKSYTLSILNLDLKPDYELLMDETFPGAKFITDGSSDISKSLDKYMDHTGWSGSYLYTAKNGIRIGRAASAGQLVSPEFSLGENDTLMTVLFTARAYNNDTNCTLDVGNNEDNIRITVPSNTDNNYIAKLVVDDPSSQSITFATNTRAKRVIISNIEIYRGDASSAAAPQRVPVETGDNMQRVITGITDTLYTVADLAPGTYEFKVKVTYTDDTESRWSTACLVTLTDPTPGLPGDVNLDGKVDVADINIVIDIILGNATIDDYPAADINGSGSCDVSDMNDLINILLGGTGTEK